MDTIARHLDALLVRQALTAEENRTLAALRDTLLPKLVSGELPVKDAEGSRRGRSERRPEHQGTADANTRVQPTTKASFSRH